MPRNVEIKARIASVEALLPIVNRLAGAPAEHLLQEDIFFYCGAGRLKLRVLGDDTGELIFYRRADRVEPTESNYIVSPTPSPATLHQVLASAYGEAARVVKRRARFIVGRTRIHLDRVDGLGDFLELEVVLSETDDVGAAVNEAYELLSDLGIAHHELVDRAYVDLLGAVTAKLNQEERPS